MRRAPPVRAVGPGPGRATRPGEPGASRREARFLVAGSSGSTTRQASSSRSPLAFERAGSLAFVILTTAANDLMRPVDDRMPVLLSPEAAAGFRGLVALRVEHAWFAGQLRALEIDNESRHELILLGDCIVRHMLGADREAAAWLVGRP